MVFCQQKHQARRSTSRRDRGTLRTCCKTTYQCRPFLCLMLIAEFGGRGVTGPLLHTCRTSPPRQMAWSSLRRYARRVQVELLGFESEELDSPGAVHVVGGEADFGRQAVVDRRHGDACLKTVLQHPPRERLLAAGPKSAAVNEDHQGSRLFGPGLPQIEHVPFVRAVAEISQIRPRLGRRVLASLGAYFVRSRYDQGKHDEQEHRASCSSHGAVLSGRLTGNVIDPQIGAAIRATNGSPEYDY